MPRYLNKHDLMSRQFLTFSRLPTPSRSQSELLPTSRGTSLDFASGCGIRLITTQTIQQMQSRCDTYEDASWPVSLQS